MAGHSKRLREIKAIFKDEGVEIEEIQHAKGGHPRVLTKCGKFTITLSASDHRYLKNLRKHIRHKKQGLPQ
jgi:hypothetical protein